LLSPPPSLLVGVCPMDQAEYRCSAFEEGRAAAANLFRRPRGGGADHPLLLRRREPSPWLPFDLVFCPFLTVAPTSLRSSLVQDQRVSTVHRCRISEFPRFLVGPFLPSADPTLPIERRSVGPSVDARQGLHSVLVVVDGPPHPTTILTVRIVRGRPKVRNSSWARLSTVT
jgi:hypothetical protein